MLVLQGEFRARLGDYIAAAKLTMGNDNKWLLVLGTADETKLQCSDCFPSVPIAMNSINIGNPLPPGGFAVTVEAARAISESLSTDVSVSALLAQPRLIGVLADPLQSAELVITDALFAAATKMAVAHQRSHCMSSGGLKAKEQCQLQGIDEGCLWIDKVHRFGSTGRNGNYVLDYVTAISMVGSSYEACRCINKLLSTCCVDGVISLVVMMHRPSYLH